MSESIKNQVKHQFGQHAEKYVTSQRHAKGEDLALLVSSSRADLGMDVLDIATGGGHVANALAPLVHQVTAYDLTSEMLEAAERFIKGNGHSNVSYVTGDAEKLPFEDGAFDLVTCRIAAHHFTDIPAFVAGALRVTKPKGKLLLIDNVAPEKDELDQFYNDVEKRRDPSHARAWKKTEWIKVLENSGYRIEQITTFAKPFEFQAWCDRAGVPALEREALEEILLNASEEAKAYFSIVTNLEGKLAGFSGEAVYFQAVRPY